MKTSIRSLIAALLCSSAALAGDPTAHTAAMLRAARTVAAKSQFTGGVGAPLKAGVPQTGKFQIPQDDNVGCAYDSSKRFGDGCPYVGVNGYAINEPDNWSCLDSRQPGAMNDLNFGISAPQSLLAAFASATLSDEASLACNWNHFANNPMIPALASAQRAADLTKSWALDVPHGIEVNGASPYVPDRCDAVTFEKYYRRAVNSLHYVQDMQSEHHADGNIACSQADVVPVVAYNRPFSFADLRGCAGFLVKTVHDAEGNDPPVWCDEAVVAQDRAAGGPIALNEKMNYIIGACDSGLSLACMGLERTIRHHCRLAGAPKSIQCSGPANDHGQAINANQYCEGELFSPAGGQDFLTAATNASVQPLADAMDRWATTCKEPDDPCVPAQCDTWCKRSMAPGAVTQGSTSAPPAVAGYCVNAAADAQCVLHQCKCTTVDLCGGAGQPCCNTGSACKDDTLECGLSTGTCTAKNSDLCSKVVATLAPATQTLAIGATGTLAVSISKGGKAADTSGYSFHWTNTGKGGALAAGGGAASNDFCSPASAVNYQPLAAQTTGTSDTITVQVFSGAGCAGTASTSATASVTVSSGTCSVAFQSYSFGPTPAGSFDCDFTPSANGATVGASFFPPELKSRQGGGLTRLSLTFNNLPLPWPAGTTNLTYPTINGTLLMPYTIGYTNMGAGTARLVVTGTSPHQQGVFTIPFAELTNENDTAVVLITVKP